MGDKVIPSLTTDWMSQVVTGLSGQYTQVLNESRFRGGVFLNLNRGITTCHSLCIQESHQTHFYPWLEWFKDNPV